MSKRIHICGDPNDPCDIECMDNAYSGPKAPITHADHEALKRRLAEVEAELKEVNEKLKYTYCAWCGQGIEISDVERAKEFVADHVRSCPDHPYAELKAERDREYVSFETIDDAIGNWGGPERDCFNLAIKLIREAALREPKKNCPNGLTPDGPICPRCGGRRGPSGVDGGSWVRY